MNANSFNTSNKSVIGIILSLVLGCLVCSAREQSHRDIYESYPVSRNGKLVVTTDWGSIDVRTADTDNVTVKVVRRVTREVKNEKRIIESHKVEIKHSSDSVFVSGSTEKDSSLRNHPLSVSYQLIVPRQFSVQLKTVGGGITVADLEGNVEANATGGEIRLGTTTGEINAKSVGGGIIIAQGGRSIRAQSTGGGIQIGSSDGPIEATSTGGGIRIQKADSSVKANATGGDIRLGQVAGKVLAQTTGGGIQIGHAGHGSVVKSTGGNVRVYEAEGSIAATANSGSIHLALIGPLQGDTVLESSGGEIELSVSSNVQAQVKAQSSGGTVKSMVKLDNKEFKSNKLTGTLNGGGYKLVATSHGGGVIIKPLEGRPRHLMPHNSGR